MRKQRIIAKRHLPVAVVPLPMAHAARLHLQKNKRLLAGVLLLCLCAFATLHILEQDTTGMAVMGTTVNVSAVAGVNCSIPLVPGLNMISLNCISNSNPIGDVLSSTDTTLIDAIYDYVPGTSDQWAVYAPNLPAYVVSDLETLSRLKGYLVYINTTQGLSTAINHDGFLSSTSSIPTRSGSNLLGYPSKINRTLPAGLTTINTSYLRVLTYDTNTSMFLEFNSTDGSAGGLYNLTPTQGYWITVASNGVWTVTSS